MSPRYKVLAGSSEVGGAECLIPLIEKLRAKGYQVVSVAGQNAGKVFRKYGTAPEYSAETAAECYDVAARAVGCVKPDAIVTGLLGYKDNIDYSLIRIAKEQHIPVMSILDSWMNYGDRVSDPKSDDKYGFLPDCIAVMDEFALQEAIADGIPESHCIVTGHTKSNQFAKIGLKRSDIECKRKILGRLNISDEKSVIVFFSQSLSECYPPKYFGYDIDDVLGILLPAFQRIREETGAVLIFKEHPRRKSICPDALSGVSGAILAYDEGADDLLVIADAVAGISSTLLVYSVALGIPTISIQPNLIAGRDANVLTRSKFMSPADSVAAVYDGFVKALAAKRSHEKPLVPGWLKLDPSACDRVERQINRLIVGKEKRAPKTGAA
jgi:hypothetical protein